MDLIDEKEKETRKLGQKYKNKRFDWMCWHWITIGRDLFLYRKRDIALWVGYDQIFPKQTKSQPLLILYLFWENQILRFRKPDGPIFVTLASYLIFFYLDHLTPFNPFIASKHLGSSNPQS
jgi:hypothetical protein